MVFQWQGILKFSHLKFVLGGSKHLTPVRLEALIILGGNGSCNLIFLYFCSELDLVHFHQTAIQRVFCGIPVVMT